MKKVMMIIMLTAELCTSSLKASAQTAELQQLTLNLQKLAQLRQILVQLKQAYAVLQGGYTTIINISKGNFSIHQTFLDGLLAVSPAVQKYKKITDIISMQVQLVEEHQEALFRLHSNKWFTSEEMKYIRNVYTRLFEASLADLEALLPIITANQLRMTDDERLKAIDRLFTGMQEKIGVLRHFSSAASLLGIQRSREQHDVEVLRKLYEISK